MIAYHPVKIPGRPRRFRVLLGLVLLLAILFGASQTGLRRLAIGASFGILGPLWTIGRGAENIFTKLSRSFVAKLELAGENAHLRNIINQQAAALLDQEILKQENLALRRVVNRSVDLLPLTMGRLVSRGWQFPFGQAVIDVGYQNVTGRLAPGMVVASGEAVILGELTEIYETSAKMRFYSVSGERLTAGLGAARIPVELIGRGDGNFGASLPRNLNVAVNDQAIVTIAGREFVLALVNDVERAAGDSFQEIFLRSPVNLTQLIWVEVYEP